ncbi:MAG TPA: DUF2341 domain-containing protein [Chitinivibrionales bacterium]|nr:DUF2341 domain-containing protein [Chitinivibrionales bacterium]
MRALFFALCAAACLCWCLCTAVTLTGGTSSSENAKVKGAIIDTAGAPAAGAHVLLIPAGFNPATDTAEKKITRDTTDAGGSYSFASVAPGTYNIMANNPVFGTSLLITGIECKKKDTVTVSTGTLKPSGTVVVALGTPAGASGAAVYIPGTTCLKSVPASATSVVLDSVPPGSIPAIMMKNLGAPADTLKSNVTVIPKDTTYLIFSAKLVINTSATGANVQNAVTHFPLLVRLSAADVDFSKFRPDGGDVRFAKADGTPLNYEIAQWDTALKQAALWVSVDTVLGGSSDQFITMTWGFSGKTSASKSSAVFDTGFGFSGVYHLEEAGSAPFKDATQNNAVGANFMTALDRTGIAGAGRDFNGTDYILVSKQILPMAANDFTIALWLNPRRERCVIVSKDTAIAQDSCAKRLYLGDAAADSSGLHPSFGGKGSGAAVSDAALSLNEWHHLVFSWSQASKTASFFIDGVKTGVESNTFAACPDNPKDRVIFGYDGAYLFGYCDEIHISKAARSDDWVKLSYENQRPDQKLVSIVK